jgi:hypothetical protein
MFPRIPAGLSRPRAEIHESWSNAAAPMTAELVGKARASLGASATVTMSAAAH